MTGFCCTRDVMVDKAHASGCGSQEAMTQDTEHKTQTTAHTTENTGRETGKPHGQAARADDTLTTSGRVGINDKEIRVTVKTSTRP
jgi:hypothetical protein